MAQQELNAIYDAAQMNETIFAGKLMEIKGRMLVASGTGSTVVNVRADSRLGRTLLAGEPSAPMETPGGTTTTPTAKPKAAPPAGGVTRARSATPTTQTPNGGPRSASTSRKRSVSPSPTLGHGPVEIPSDTDEALVIVERSGTK